MVNWGTVERINGKKHAVESIVGKMVNSTDTYPFHIA